MNTNGTNFQNGKFVNVDEVHNNTKNMTLSGFNQEGGTVTGNIQNLTIESKQNTPTTKGSTKGGSLTIAQNGIPLQQEKPITIIYTKSDGKKFYGKYKPSPKHDPKTGYPGANKSNIPDIETGQELLEDSYGSSKVKQRYVWYRGRLVEFQPGMVELGMIIL